MKVTISYQPNTTSSSFEPLVRDYTTQLDWVIPIAVTIILMILTLWILISLVHYGIKTGKWRRKRASHVDMLSIGLVYSAVVACAGTCMVFFSINLVYLNIGFSSHQQDKLCEIIGDSAVACYGFVLYSVALFLWFRQRLFFRNEMLSVSYTKCVHMLSSSSIVIILIGALGVLVINILPNTRQAGADGCLFEVGDDYKVLNWISVVILVVIGQGMLLGLFAYAIIRTKDGEIVSPKFSNLPETRHASDISSSAYDFTNCSYTSGSSNVPARGLQSPQIQTAGSNQSQGVRKILHKTLIFAVLSTLADIFNQVMIYYINASNKHRRYVTTVSNLNAFLNLVFLLLSFVQYKHILISPCRKQAYVRK